MTYYNVQFTKLRSFFKESDMSRVQPIIAPGNNNLFGVCIMLFDIEDGEACQLINGTWVSALVKVKYNSDCSKVCRPNSMSS